MSTTFDQATNLSFYTNNLINLDKEIHKPITNVTWGKAIKLRDGVSISDEYTAFIRSSWGSTGTTSLGGIPWISQNTTDFPNVSLTGERIATPVRLAGHMISYTKVDIEKARREGHNLDSEKTEALHEIYQLGIDQMVYVGDKTQDTTEHKCRGLLNSDQVSVTDASADFASMDSDTIVDEINTLLEMVWSQTAYAIMPNMVIMPPKVYAKIATTKYSSNGEKTILTYLRENCLATTTAGTTPTFMPCVWCNDAGADGKGRIIAYSNELKHVRFNMAPIRREESYVDKGIYYNTPYIWALGEVEFVRPQTAAYLDKVTK